MTTYCYSLYDSKRGEFSPLQTHPKDSIAVFEFVRYCILSSLSGDPKNLVVECDLNPFRWDKDHFEFSDTFWNRFDIFRLGIFDTDTGLVDGSVERVSLYDDFRKVAGEFRDYYNGLDFYKNLEVNDDES